MSDDKRLKDKLEKLSAEETSGPGGRAVTHPDLRLGILNEIDETILGRVLSFRNPEGDVLELDVLGRRLMRVRSAPATAAKGDASALTAPLEADSDALLSRIMSMIGAFAAASSALAVTTASLPQRPEPSVVGRSAEAMARILGLDLYSDAAPSAPDAPAVPDHAATASELAVPKGSGIEGMIAALEGEALAWVWIGASGTLSSGGDATLLGPLAAAAETGTAALAGALGAGVVPADGQSLILRTRDADGRAIFLGMAGGEGLLMLLPSTQSGSLARVWGAAVSPA